MQQLSVGGRPGALGAAQGPRLAANLPQTSLPVNSQKPHALELESRVGAKTWLDPSARVDQERRGLPHPRDHREQDRGGGGEQPRNSFAPLSKHTPAPSRDEPLPLVSGKL